MQTATAELRGHIVALRRERVHRRRVFSPPPRLSVSQWAESHRMLSAETCPQPGQWHSDQVPYLREIMDAISDPTCERVVFMKSARVGGTEGLNNGLGYVMDQAPGPAMVIQPTVDDAKGWSKEQLAPMLRDTPRLRGLVRESGRRESRDTIQLKMFPGGFLVVVGSNSATGLRRRSIRYLFADEVDGYGVSAKSAGGKRVEGDPLTLAIKRTENFWNRKIYETSSPTIKGASRIEYDYGLSDQRRYYVPCPHCGQEQTLKWRNLRYENNDPTTVVYICGELDKDMRLLTGTGCGRAISEEHKPWMVNNGKWIPGKPGRSWRGYHIWAAYSLLTTWARLVEQWIEAQGNTELLRVFVNQVLGETWNERGEAIPQAAILARREHYPAMEDGTILVPKGAGALTLGLDVQPDRLEYSLWAWGTGEESWLVKHEAIWGDPVQPEVWHALDLVIARPWRHALGLDLRISATCVDSGGQNTDEVYRYCQTRERHRVFAIKGASEAGRAAVGKPSLVADKKVKLFSLGTDTIKDTLLGRLERTTTAGPGYVHLPMVDEEYVRQLTAEVVRVRWVNMRPVRDYVKVYDRNEALDCWVYAYAALIISGFRDQLGLLVAQLGARAAGTPAGPGASGSPSSGGRRIRSKGID